MSRSLDQRAAALLATGRVCVPDLRRALVSGEHGVYEVQVVGLATLVCECVGFSRRGMCAHVRAVGALVRCDPASSRSP